MNKIVWYHVKKKTPRNGTNVLAICGGRIKELSYKNNSWGENYHPSAITHWAYLNKPRLKKPKRVEVKIKKAHQIMGANFETFKSPVDGSIISCQSKLREHNKKNGVTNIADYSPEHFEKRGKEMALEASGQTPEAKQERKELIAETLHKFGV